MRPWLYKLLATVFYSVLIASHFWLIYRDAPALAGAVYGVALFAGTASALLYMLGLKHLRLAGATDYEVAALGTGARLGMMSLSAMALFCGAVGFVLDILVSILMPEEAASGFRITKYVQLGGEGIFLASIAFMCLTGLIFEEEDDDDGDDDEPPAAPPPHGGGGKRRKKLKMSLRGILRRLKQRGGTRTPSLN